MSVILRIFRIQHGEGRTVGLVVAFMFSSVAGLTIGESGISALFFERVGPEALPVMYLAQAAAGVVVMLALTGVLARFQRRRTYVWLPVMLALAVAVERLAVAGDAVWIYWAMYLTTSVSYVIQAVYLWGAAGAVTDTRRAKRLFPLFSAGNILGAVVGGLVTQPLASAIGAENLLVVWIVAQVASSLACVAIVGRRAAKRHRRLRRRSDASAIGELVAGFRAVRRSPLLVWMSVSAVLFSVLFYSLYLPYAQAATVEFPDPDDLAGFFGIFWAVVTAVAFIVSILLTNRLLGRFGAAAMLLVLPLLYGGAFGILLVTATFPVLVAIRFGANVWLQGVSSPAWETLTNVTPEEWRDQTRAFFNGGPSQAGTAIAGAIALVGQEALSTRQLAVIGLIGAAVTVVVCWRIRASYPGALVAAIRSGRPRVFDEPVRAPVAVRPDASAIAVAERMGGDADPRMRRLATFLLRGADDDRSVGVLRSACGDGDATVRADAIAALAEVGRLSAEDVARAAADVDRRVRLTLARADVRFPDALLDDPDPAVAVAAAIRRGGVDERVRRYLVDPEVDVRLAATRELARARRPEAAAAALPLAEDPSPAVRAAALDALSAEASLVVGPALAALMSPEPLVVSSAARALELADPGAVRDDLRAIVDERSEAALADGKLASSLPPDGETTELLRDALMSRARSNAALALTAASVGKGREDLEVALEILRGREASHLATALEAVESTIGTSRARALLSLWEQTPTGARSDGDPVDTAAVDPDPLIRACAELVRRREGGDRMGHAVGSMSPIELLLVLRRIRLFAALEPNEVQRVAEIAEERGYVDGDVLGHQDELGDELHIVLEGAVRVVRNGVEIARRTDGDVVGEMSLLTRAPRVASLVAEGQVRTVRIGRRAFEGMVRERPEIALAVMRVLAERLAAVTGPDPATTA